MQRRHPLPAHARSEVALRHRRRPGREIEVGIIPARRRRSLGALALAILVGGAAASALGAVAWRSYVALQTTRTIDSTSTAAASALSIALQRDTELSATAQTLVETTPSLTDAQFSEWFRLLAASGMDPGSFGLLYVERVPARQLRGFERSVASEPPLGLAEPGAGIVPATSSTEHCLVRAGAVQLSGTPFTPAELSGLLQFEEPDLDYCALPLAGVLRQSARAASTAAFSLSSLMSSGPALPGVPVASTPLRRALTAAGLIATVTPVYPGGSVPAPPGTRLARTEGWIIAIYQANSILAPILDGRHVAAVLSFTNPSGVPVVLARRGVVSNLASTRTFRLAAAPWSVTLSVAPADSGISSLAQGMAVLATGLLVSVVLSLFVLALSRSRARALQLVEVQTEQLRHLALHDDLTGLPNRALIYDRASQMLARAQRDGKAVAALFIDLDQFKDVNDTLGHGAGDDLLRQVAARLAALVRNTDTVGRLGGDEFVVLVEGSPGSAEAVQLAERVVGSLQEPFELAGGRRVVVSASIGIAEEMLGSTDSLLSDADIALYAAKATATGGHVLFEPAMRASIAARIGLEAELREAMRSRQFFRRLPADPRPRQPGDHRRRGPAALEASAARCRRAR